MIKFVLVFLYLFSGSPKLDQVPYDDEATCYDKGQKRIEELEKDPRYGGGMFAACIPLEVQEAKK